MELSALRLELEELKAFVLPRIKSLETRIAALEAGHGEEQPERPARSSVVFDDAARLSLLRASAGELNEEEALELEILAEKEELRKLKEEKERFRQRQEEQQRKLSLEPLSHTAPLPRISEAEANLRALQLEVEGLSASNSPPKAVVLDVEIETDGGESPQKLVESPPDEDELRRRPRRGSAGLMRLSSTQSFSTSPQADLASSPLLKRAVRRSRPMNKPLPTPGQDDDDDDDGDGDGVDYDGADDDDDDDNSNTNSQTEEEDNSSDKGGSGKERRNSLTDSDVIRKLTSEVIIEEKPSVDDLKRQFADASKKYYVWVAEALEDVSFRLFGDTLEEVQSFKETLDESDKDIAVPSETQYREISVLWKQLQACKADDASPYSSLKLDDVEEMFQSVVRAIATRRQCFDQLLGELVAKKKPEPVVSVIVEKTVVVVQGPAPNRPISIDFDISKELSSLNFDSSGAGSSSAEVAKEIESVMMKTTEQSLLASPPVAAKKINVGDEVEAVWDQDGQWYRARIDEETAFGFWLTFVEYGNSQDTAPHCVRSLVRAKGEPTPASRAPSLGSSSGVAAGSKLVAKKQKAPLNKVVGPKKAAASGSTSPPVVRAADQEPVQEDVRAPVGGIAARMAMLALEKEQASGGKKQEKRLSGMDQRQVPVKALGTQLESVMVVKPRHVSSGSDDEDGDSDPDSGGDSDDDSSASSSTGRIVIPVKIEQVKKVDNAVVAGLAAEATHAASASSSSVSKGSTCATEASPRKVVGAHSPSPPPPSSPPPATSPSAPPVSADDSERKLLVLREQLRKSRAEAASPVKTVSAGKGSPLPVKKASENAVAAVAPAAVVVSSGGLKYVNGSEPIPLHLSNTDEILAVAMQAEALVAPPEGVIEPVDLPARDRKRYESFIALIDSEREYYNQLAILMSVFVIPLRDSKKLNGFEILNSDDMDELFGNLPTLWGVHKLFLAALIDCANTWTVERGVASVIELFAPSFKLYGAYTGHVGKGMVALTKFKTKHVRGKEFKDLLAAGEASPACAGTNLRSLLNLPVRRPSAYPPLVRTLLKNTPKGHRDAEQLESACRTLELK